MNHPRVLVFRDALADLIESIEATVRTPGAGTDEPADAAGKLQARLSTAGRLASGKFSGARSDAPHVASICGKMSQLESAYVSYCRRLRANEAPAKAQVDLMSALADARSGLHL